VEGVVGLHEVIHDLKSKKKLVLKIDFEKTYDKVRWKFLAEFPDKWINMVMKTPENEKVYGNINGESSKYFKTFMGLRQGDRSLLCSLI
jgi:hypothetical protein